MSKKWALHVFDFLSSVKLAVIVILGLAAILAVGTFYEAEYGTAAAHRVIYKSWYVSLEMLLLVINLSCAAIDRLPWKKHHIGFVVTHAGIITLIAGSFITQQRGLDGNLALGINENSETFTTSETELQVFQTLNGRPFSTLVQSAVDFDRRPPNKNAYSFKLVDDDKLIVTRYIPKASRKLTVSPSELRESKPSLLFRISNQMVNVSEWLSLDGVIPSFYDLGPALVTFISGPIPKPPQNRNQIVFSVGDKGIDYAVFSARSGKSVQSGRLKVGEKYETGWMNLKFSVEAFYPHSDIRVRYEPAEEDLEATVPAVELELDGRKKWFELGSPLEMKGKNTSYFIDFTNKRYHLGFSVALKRFKMGRYGGSLLPRSYESTVSVDSGADQIISMNEPLTNQNFTLYQSSFEQNERGEPVASVFSVNYDPGRQTKYVGAICIVLGIAIMFYLKPRWSRKKRE